MYELLNKATTNTWVDERQAFFILRDAAKTIRGYIAYYKFKHLRNYLIKAESKARAIYAPVANDTGKQRDLCS